LALVTEMSEKSKPTSPSAIQVKNRRKTIRIEEKFDNSVGITKSAKSGIKEFVQQDCHSPNGMGVPKIIHVFYIFLH
jgi:hypothetical protein